jgi:phage baseplate assembly protein W
MPGFGSGGWGDSPWGSGDDELRLLSALAVRENAVRLTFSAPPLFNGILDAHDASNPARYNFVPVPGTIGSDGLPARPVFAVSAAEVGGGGAQIDVTLDRPMSPYPAVYIASVNGLVTSESELLLAIGATSTLFFGVHRFVPPPSTDTAIPSRDVANPQTRAALTGPEALSYTNDSVLGTIPVDSSGDYAFDAGLTNLKKRIYRRLITSKGRFGHLPEYGIGVPDQIKKLNSAAVRQQVVAEAEKQISQEPDVEQVRVTIVSDPASPSIVRFRIKVRAKFSQAPFDVDIPFSPTGS